MTRNDALRAELLQMSRADQELRNRAIQDWNNKQLIEQMQEADQKNTARMRKIVDTYGWPGNTLVGQDGASAAWLLVQHADADLPFQKRCLELMMAVGPDEVSALNLAYLVDRVRVGEGLPQVYGTQFWTDATGKLRPAPIEDEAEVDERRARVGLESLDIYRKTMMDLSQR